MKYDAFFNDFKYKEDMRLKYGIPMPGKKEDVNWIGEYPKQIQKYVVENKNNEESSLSSNLGCLANILLKIDKYKFQDLATELHLGSKNTKSVAKAIGMKGILKPKARNAWLHYQDLAGFVML